jgi:hypothetical protein
VSTSQLEKMKARAKTSGTPEARAKARQELRRELAKEMKRAQIIREAAALGRTPHFDVE